MKMIHEIGRAVFLTTEYRTVKAAFLTSTPEEQERRFFYALMLRSRGRKSLDLCGFQNAQKTRARKDTFALDSGAVYCWDNPITAGSHCIYLERDITNRLNRYSNDGSITQVWVWAEDRGDGSYDLYIGYA